MAEDKTKILVVDDDPFVREMLADILQSDGYQTDTAGDGKEALGVIEKGNGLGLILSDMNMPGMDGLELIREVRRRGLDTPIIILTGNNEISVAIEAMNSGANDYLIKDENIQDTVTLSVAKVIEKQELKRQNQRLMEDLARENDRLEREKALAQKVQRNILPRDIRAEGFEVGSYYRPSDKIGGDFFDAWRTARGTHFLIGDVSGHSTSSALIMAVCKGMLQSLGFTMDDPVEIVATANRMLCEILTDGGMFLSLVYAVHDHESGRLRVVSAGHNPVFIAGDGELGVVESTGPVMGWDAGDAWEAVDLPLARGSCLALYTDGLVEIKDASGAEFGEERLKGLLRGGAEPSLLIGEVIDEVASFGGGVFPDDLTLFVINKV